MKNKKGFTLVEVLAILSVLGIMVMLIFPNIGGSIESKKEKELEKTINIVESAGKAYFSFNDNIYKVELNTLINDEYITTNMTNPKTGEGLDGCVRKTLDNDLYVYTYGSCEPILVPFSVELNGGESSQTFENAYYDTTKIELKNPTHQNADFNGWKIVKGNSLLKGNTLVIGTTETILYAVYEEWGELTIDLDGGTVSNNQNGKYKSNTTIELEVPLKENYKFIEWEIIKGNGIVSGTTFTMGSNDTKIKAKWELNVFKLNVELKGGTISKDYSGDYEVGSTITIEDPTRTGYTFNGWSVSGTGASMSGTTLTIGAGNVTLTANWIENTYTISYTLNGGTSGSSAPTSGTYGSTVTVSNPTRTGYTFTGWSVSGTGTVLSGTNLTIGTGDVTLTANWKLSKLYLYDSGNTYSSVTGGWVVAKTSTSSSGYVNSFTLNSDSIYLRSRKNEYSAGGATSWAFYFAGYTKLKAVVNTDGGGYMCIVEWGQLNNFDLYVIKSVSLGSGWQEITLDISDVEKGHVAFDISGSISRAAYIYKVWLE